MSKRILTALLALCMILSLFACGAKQNETPEPEPVPGGINCLTGLPIDPDYENDRPVAVMLNNHKAAVPQLGVSQADVIYEIPAEGGITRMIGLFQTLHGVGTLGSIRSTRPYYLEVALGHDALLVHAGGSPEAYEDIKAWGVNNMDGVNGGSDAQIFWRDSARRKSAGFEHSLVTSGENVLNYLARGRYRTEHKDGYSYPVTFTDDGTPAGGTPATHVKLRFSDYKTGTFEYDEDSKRYLVGQYGGAYKDGNTGTQVGVTNVLILETDISNISGDTSGRIRVRTTGTGSGTYCCGGQCVRIQWSKEGRNSPFTYSLADGTPLSLGKGTSYVCIISTKRSTLTIE